MALNERQKKQLRQLGHARKPVVIVGAQGLRDSVLAEIDRALTDHELIKVRVNAGDRTARDAMVGTLCNASGAHLVQRIGHVVLLYRQHPEQPRIVLG